MERQSTMNRQVSQAGSGETRSRARLCAAPLVVIAALVAFVGCTPTYKDNSAFDVYLVLRYLNGPKYVFSTASAFNGNLGGVSGADAKCAADGQAVGGIYRALIVSGSVRRACSTAQCSGGTGEHIDWVLAANQEYRRSGGVTVVGTTGSTGLFAFPLTNAFAASGTYWTGLKSDWLSGATPTFDCASWSGTATNGHFGTSGTSVTAIADGPAGDPCAVTHRLICVQQ